MDLCLTMFIIMIITAEGLDRTVCGWEIFPEIGELKKVLDILRSK